MLDVCYTLLGVVYSCVYMDIHLYNGVGGGYTYASVISFLTREEAIILIFLLCVFDFIAGRIMNAIFFEDKYYAFMADITVKM